MTDTQSLSIIERYVQMVHSILNLPNLTDIFVVNDYIVIVRSRTYNGANEIFTLYIESVTRHIYLYDYINVVTYHYSRMETQYFETLQFQTRN